MMTFKCELWNLALTVFLLGAMGLVLSAQTVDEDKLLKELEVLEKGRSGEYQVAVQRHIGSLTSAVGDKQAAITLYTQAIDATEYDGKKRDAAEYAEWRDRNKDILANDKFRTALQLHIQYIILSLKRLNGQTNEQLLPELLSHIARVATLNTELLKMDKLSDELDSRADAGGKDSGNNHARDRQTAGSTRSITSAARGMLNKAIGGSEICRWYRLDSYFSEIKEWSQSGGDIEGILDATIMPLMREKKDPRLIGLWDERIARADEEGHRSGLAIDDDKFQNQTLPTLLWSRAKDRIILGQRSMAILEMYNVVKTYQSNAQFESWSKELKATIKGEPVAGDLAAPAPVTNSTSVPAPATSTSDSTPGSNVN